MIQCFYLLEYPYNIKPDIKILKNDKNILAQRLEEKNMDLSIFKKFANNTEKIDKLKKKNPESELAKIEKKVRNTARINNTQFITFLFKECTDLTYNVNHSDYKKKNCISLYKDGKILGDEYDNILFSCIRTSTTTESFEKELNKLDLCEKEDILYNIRLSIIMRLFNNLQIGGLFVTNIFDFCSIKSFNILYLLSLLFDKVMILKGERICCYGFLGQTRLSLEKIEKLFNKNISIKPMYNLDNLLIYLKDFYTYRNELLDDLLKKKYKDYIIKSFENYIDCMIEKEVNYKYIYTLMNNFDNIFNIYKSKEWLFKFINQNKKVKQLCLTIERLIQQSQPRHILQIGLGMGVYTNCILKNKDIFLISIDPEQKEIWNNYGLERIEKDKIKKDNFKLYTNDTIKSLEEINDKYGDYYFDIILIDKCESFDKLLFILYYVKKLIRTNGYIIFDKMFSIGFLKLFDFIDKNYKDLERINDNILKKTNDKYMNIDDYYIF